MDLKDQLEELKKENSNPCRMKIDYNDVVAEISINLIKYRMILEDVKKYLDLQREVGQLVTVVNDKNVEKLRSVKRKKGRNLL